MGYPFERYPLITQLYRGVDPSRLVDTADPATDFLYRLLVDASDLCDRWRQRYEDLLAVANRHELLGDRAFTSRLRTKNRRSIFPVLSELEAADFFAASGYSVEFNPPGKGAHIGEFTLTTKRQQLFVEVKTMFERSWTQDRIDSRIVRAVESIEAPFAVRIAVVAYSSDLRSRHLREWLQNELCSITTSGEASNLAGPPIAQLEYRDRSFCVQFGVFRVPSATRVRWWQMHGGLLATPLYVRASVREAYKQLPDKPNLVLLRSYLQLGPDREDMVNALYGTESVVFNAPKFTESWTTRADDGSFGPKHKRLSAVAMLNLSGPVETPTFELDVYHSIWSRNRWDADAVQALTIHHLVPQSETSLTWRDFVPTPS